MCSTSVVPIRAPKCFGSAEIVRKVCGGDVEQQAINNLLVGIGDGADGRGQGEDHVVVRHRQQVSLPRFEPALCSAALALRTVPVPTRVVSDLGLRAR